MKGRENTERRLAVALAIALLLHLFLGVMGHHYYMPVKEPAPAQSIVIDLSDPEEEPQEEPPEDQTQPELRLHGQLVELPEPDEIEKPEEADYLSEYEQSVVEEMRSEKYKINPDILAPVYSEDAQTSEETATDMQMEEDSTGATAGQENDLPEAQFALFPDRFSRWAYTNKLGEENPVMAVADASQRLGAPQNDYLSEKVGPATLLNSHEFLYADYFNKIRRLVNFWWSQNLDNLSPRDIGQPVRRPQYRTAVRATLDAKGNLVEIKLLKSCGIKAFDTAVLNAWKAASRYPAPPAGLVRNGRAELINFEFILEMGRGESQFTAIDPRANVRFPGIAWPR